MAQESLVMDEIEAGADLIRAMARLHKIGVAFWLREDDEDQRQLYISSDDFDLANRPAAYETLTRLMDQHPSIFIEPLQVNLIGGDDRWAVAAKQFNDRSADRLGTRLRSVAFAGQPIADAYIYPVDLSPSFPRFG